MTTRTRRALYRVRNAARRLVQAVDALRSELKTLPGATRASLWGARAVALIVDRRLTDVLGPDALTPSEKYAANYLKRAQMEAHEKFAASRDPDNALMEAQDAAADAAQETA